MKYSDNYNPEVLETFPNKHPENEYLVTFNCPEFTTLCPKTGQPDFGHIYISYIPRERMVESKSLKLYLFSFRNHGDFHEDCVNIIMKDLVKLMDPKYLEVTGYFMPRGGISIYPFANYADEDHEELKAQRLCEQFTNANAIMRLTIYSVNMKDSLIVLSGGLDSTTMLYEYQYRIGMAVSFPLRQQP